MLSTVIITLKGAYGMQRGVRTISGSNVTKQALTSILLNSVPKLFEAKNMTTFEELGEILTCRAMLV